MSLTEEWYCQIKQCMGVQGGRGFSWKYHAAGSREQLLDSLTPRAADHP